MDKTEALKILAILKAAYPNSYKGMSQDEALSTAAVWAMQFSELPVDIVMMAISKAISACKYPPSIAEVKEKIMKVHWDAWEELRMHNSLSKGDIPAKRRYQRIIDLTEHYRISADMTEPSVRVMLPLVEQGAINPLALDGGDTPG